VSLSACPKPARVRLGSQYRTTRTHAANAAAAATPAAARGDAEDGDAQLRAVVQAALRGEMGSEGCEGGDEPLGQRLATMQARLCGLEAALERERTRAHWTTAAAGVAAAAALAACVLVVRY
jgi:hypothetical protein